MKWIQIQNVQVLFIGEFKIGYERRPDSLYYLIGDIKEELYSPVSTQYDAIMIIQSISQATGLEMDDYSTPDQNDRTLWYKIGYPDTTSVRYEVVNGKVYVNGGEGISNTASLVDRRIKDSLVGQVSVPNPPYEFSITLEDRNKFFTNAPSNSQYSIGEDVIWTLPTNQTVGLVYHFVAVLDPVLSKLIVNGSNIHSSHGSGSTLISTIKGANATIVCVQEGRWELINETPNGWIVN